MGRNDTPSAFETVRFASKDGLLITADYYPTDKPKSSILLCHRSHCNRGEYRETAPRLNKFWQTDFRNLSKKGKLRM